MMGSIKMTPGQRFPHQQSHWDSDDEQGFPSEIEQGYIMIKHEVADRVNVGNMTPVILTSEGVCKASVVLMSNHTQVTVHISKCTPCTSANRERESLCGTSLSRKGCVKIYHTMLVH